MSDVPQTIASRYRVLSVLGKGGMGVVYLVEHMRTGDQLAMKLLLSRLGTEAHIVERFKREARASALIKSEHVVRVTDADVAPELDGAPFLVMELLQGFDLKKLLETHGRLSPAEVVEYLSQVARTLDKAHALGIIHRDLKPENIFLHEREDGSRIVKILDFGISKMAGGDISGASMTQTGMILGTPHFMSPEQARGESDKIGPGSDIWALGLIANKLLTGETYWKAGSMAELMVQIIAAPLLPPTTHAPWLPATFDAWFARSCNRDIGARWPSVTEQIAALAVAFGLPPPATLSQSTPSLSGPQGAVYASSNSTRVVPEASNSGTVPFAMAATVTGPDTHQMNALGSGSGSGSGAFAHHGVARMVSPSESLSIVIPKSSIVAKLSLVFLGLLVLLAGVIIVVWKMPAPAASGVQPAPSASPVASVAPVGSTAPVVSVASAAPSVTVDVPPSPSASAARPRPSATGKPSSRPAAPATKPTSFNPAAP